MKTIKKIVIKNFNKHIAALLLLVFLVPVTINTIHDFLNHEHVVCNSKIDNHIHEKDIDCSLHLLKQADTFLAEDNYEILKQTIYSKNSTTNYKYLKNHHQLQFSLRGPPTTI